MDLEVVAGIGRCLRFVPPCFSIGAQGVLFGERREGFGTQVFGLSPSFHDLVQRRVQVASPWSAGSGQHPCLYVAPWSFSPHASHGTYTTVGMVS